MKLVSRRRFLQIGFAAVAALSFPERSLAGGPRKRNRIKRNQYATNNPRNDPGDVILARMLFGETRQDNVTDTERIAVGYTAINRLNDPERRFGTSLHGVILARSQYSCFDRRDPNRPRVLDPESYEPKTFYRCLDLARKILGSQCEDPACANHYHEASLPRPKSWPATIKQIGRIVVDKTEEGGPIYSRHTFYAG
jgi:N-acetylmuramoyl-L-alanine amidase